MKCKWLGHKWEPVYIGGFDVGNEPQDIIACFCARCGYGREQIHKLLMHPHEYETYTDKYYDEAIERLKEE